MRNASKNLNDQFQDPLHKALKEIQSPLPRSNQNKRSHQDMEEVNLFSAESPSEEEPEEEEKKPKKKRKLS